jgi:hypothetical protein
MKLAPIARATLVLTLLLPVMSLPAGCAPVTAGYSPVAHNVATSLKADTLALIDTAGDPYANHATQVDALTARIDQASALAASTPQNSLTARQWSVLGDPDRGLYGGTVKLWRAQGTLSPTYRDQKKIQIGRAFDYITCLEVNKQQAQSCGDIQEGGAP